MYINVVAYCIHVVAFFNFVFSLYIHCIFCFEKDVMNVLLSLFKKIKTK